MSPSEYNDPQAYWEQRLSSQFGLRGVGYATLGVSYNHYLYQARFRALERLLKKSGLGLRGKRVLEIGCGTGIYTERCRRYGVASYTGVDLTQVSVRNLASQYPEFQFMQADTSDTAFPVREAFDIVLVADVLFHIVDDNQFAAAVANISRCVAPDGSLILSDLLTSSTLQTASHCRFRSLASYSSALAEHGLQVRHVEPIFGVLHPPVPVPGASVQWQICALIWRYVLLPFARYRTYRQISAVSSRPGILKQPR